MSRAGLLPTPKPKIVLKMRGTGEGWSTTVRSAATVNCKDLSAIVLAGRYRFHGRYNGRALYKSTRSSLELYYNAVESTWSIGPNHTSDSVYAIVADPAQVPWRVRNVWAVSNGVSFVPDPSFFVYEDCSELPHAGADVEEVRDLKDKTFYLHAVQYTVTEVLPGLPRMVIARAANSNEDFYISQTLVERLSHPSAKYTPADRLPVNWPDSIIYRSRNVWTPDARQAAFPNRPTDGVEIRMSLRINEPGLFATKIFQPKDEIGFYTGEVVLPSDGSDSKYIAGMAKCPGSPDIDAEKFGNEMRFINDYRGLAPAANANMDTISCEKCSEWMVKVSATTVILPGQEILLDYGDSYWQVVGYPTGYIPGLAVIGSMQGVQHAAAK
eukprot:m.95596 g.95596  ORF g.95596 m.95596 type:complete len:383 (-) comp8607_c0_seq4:442-1590(-)